MRRPHSYGLGECGREDPTKIRPRPRQIIGGGVVTLNSTKRTPHSKPPARSEDLSRSALVAKSHSREEARRSVSGEAGPDRVLARVPLHPAWTGHPDARSSDRFELHHDPVQPTGLTRACRSNRAGHFQGEGREAERGGTSSDGRDDRLVPTNKVRSVRICPI